MKQKWNSFSHPRSTWRKKRAAFDEKNTLLTFKHGGGLIIAQVNGRVASSKYQHILEATAMESVTETKLEYDELLRQDKDPKHILKSSMNYLKKCSAAESLGMASQSSDMDVIENR